MQNVGWTARTDRSPAWDHRSPDITTRRKAPDGHHTMNENTITATDAEFGTMISESTPVLVDFWAEWCQPCRIVGPIVDELATDYAGTLRVAKLNVDENPKTAMQYDVMGIPTLIVFKDGVEKKRIVGARPKHALVQELADFV